MGKGAKGKGKAKGKAKKKAKAKAKTKGNTTAKAQAKAKAKEKPMAKVGPRGSVRSRPCHGSENVSCRDLTPLCCGWVSCKATCRTKALRSMCEDFSRSMHGTVWMA